MAASVLGIEQLFIERCIFNMLASDNRTLEEALAAYNVSLQDGTANEPSSASDEMFSSDILTILAAMSSQVCPGQPSCSGRGTCANSTCTCSAGKFTFVGIITMLRRQVLRSSAAPGATAASVPLVTALGRWERDKKYNIMTNQSARANGIPKKS